MQVRGSPVDEAEECPCLAANGEPVGHVFRWPGLRLPWLQWVIVCGESRQRQDFGYDLLDVRPGFLLVLTLPGKVAFELGRASMAAMSRGYR